MRITKPDERKEADMNWEDLAKQLGNAGWTLGKGCLRKELDDGMEYRIWKMKSSTAIIGYGTCDPNRIDNVREQFLQRQDEFILGESFGNYIWLKYKDKSNRPKNLQYNQVPAALRDFENQLRGAGVLSGWGTASVEDREVQPPRSVAAASASRQVNNNTTFEQALKEIPDSAFQQGTGFWKTKENPWFEFTEFVLTDEDKDAIASYNKGKEKKDTYIHLDAPPQPYIGYPDASIWLLLKNPSYSPVDVAEITGVIPENLVELIDQQSLTYINFGEKTSPQNRLNLIMAQLSFKQESSFYPFKEDFNVWDHNGGSPQGSYRWWSKYLLNSNICGGKPDKLNNFFVLESFPYHSQKFGTIKPWIHSKLHFWFWVSMVAYALRNNIILLCRGMDIASRAAAIANEIDKHSAKSNQIFVGQSSESFPISTDNFISYEAEKKKRQLLNGAKKEFEDMIPWKVKEN